MSDQFHVTLNRKSIIAERFDASGMYQEILEGKGGSIAFLLVVGSCPKSSYVRLGKLS
jgi:hypothetical protein